MGNTTPCGRGLGPQFLSPTLISFPDVWTLGFHNCPNILVPSREQKAVCSSRSIFVGLGQSQERPPPRGSICLSEARKSMVPLPPFWSLTAHLRPSQGCTFCHTVGLTGKVPAVSPKPTARNLLPTSSTIATGSGVSSVSRLPFHLHPPTDVLTVSSSNKRQHPNEENSWNGLRFVQIPNFRS